MTSGVRRGTRRVSAVLMASGLLVLAACTSGTNGNSSTAGTVTSTQSPPPQTASGSASPGTSAPDSTGATDDSGRRAITKAEVDAALGKVDGFVQDEMTRTGVPGVAVGIVYQDQLVFQQGYGLREVGKPETIDPATVFQLASLSKPISSTALAALAGKGVISWTEPVKDHDPDLVFSDPWVTDHITFADLYAHRSGLPGGVGDSLEAIGYSRDEVLQRLRYVPLNPFRVTYGYSNFGLTAGGDAAAKAAGVPFDQLMDEQLFKPAGMTTASARYADFLAQPDRATIHARIDDKWVPGPERMPDAQAPAGGMTGSVTDLARWVRLQLNEGSLDGQQIVDAKALDATHTPQILRSALATPDAPGAFYGLGWNVDYDHLGYVRWSHSGAFTNGAATNVTLIPKEKLGVIVLTNGMPIGVPETIADEIVDTIATGAPTKDWPTIWATRFGGLFAQNPDLAQTPANPTPAQPNEAYVGSYANDFYGTFEVAQTPTGGLQLIEGPAKKTYALSHFDANTFSYVSAPELPDNPVPMSFIIGADGRAGSIDIGDGDGAGLGTLKRVS